MKLRKNRVVEREAVNATRIFFESNSCVFQEIDANNDYGKDAYVDLTSNDELTGLCVALQIKGGRSYKTKTGYSIPIRDHLDYWRNSTIPIAGIILDPEDQKIRWCNISKYLNDQNLQELTTIVIDKNNILDNRSLHNEFKSSFSNFSFGTFDHPLLQIITTDEDRQFASLNDCFALGRKDFRILVGLRYLLFTLNNEPLFKAIHLLSHTTPHPDIFWTPNNWISENNSKKVREYFIWEISEIEYLLSRVTWDYWGRGQIGESLYMLFIQDPNIKYKIEKIAIENINKNKNDIALSAFLLSIYWAGEQGLSEYQKLMDIDSKFSKIEFLQDIQGILEHFGSIDIF